MQLSVDNSVLPVRGSAKPDLAALRIRARLVVKAAMFAADINQVSVAIDTGLNESLVSRQVTRGLNLYTWLAVKNPVFWERIVMFIRDEQGLDDRPGELSLRERVIKQEKQITKQAQQIETLQQQTEALLALVQQLIAPDKPAA